MACSLSVASSYALKKKMCASLLLVLPFLVPGSLQLTCCLLQLSSPALQIKGDSVYSKLKWEAGVHRVQRVPATEAAGRVHTSTATVAIMPEVDEVDVTLDMRDVDIKFAR
jgi:hypothetical protein